MRYQERIYIQNDNRAVRNKDILNVNMSSDFCIFKSPRFDVSGATKVQCSNTECVLTGYSFNDMLTASTSCFLTGSTACYSATTWSTKIYEDSTLVYDEIFYVTTSLTSDTPTTSAFTISVATAFNSLGYNYSQDDTTFNVYKPYGVKEMDIDVCVGFAVSNGSFGCPVGYTNNIDNDGCTKLNVTAATFNGSGTTIVAGDKNAGNYSIFGACFYPSIEGNGALPVYYIDSGNDLKDQSGGTVTPIVTAATNTFWGNPFLSTSDGRLNNIGISADTTYAGFSKCIDIPSGDTYYVGIAADNRCKFTVNGVLYAEFSGSPQDNFRKWSVFPFYLNSGLNIIEMYGENNSSSPSAFGAEIYHPSSFSVLTGATTTASTEANVIFTTLEFIGQQFNAGTTAGYSCPVGYSLNTCGTAYTCTEILRSNYTGSCTDICTGTCVTVCDYEFPYIASGSTGVYLIDEETSIPITFNFTANTNVFTASNATFKYEIYKYNPNIGIFTVPPVYRSGKFSYTGNTLNESIPLSAISMDGDYLIKGYYEADACTDYLYRLGKKIDTVSYKKGPAFQLYDSDLDYYFVALRKADTPIFSQSDNNQLAFYDALPLYQQVIIVDDAAEPAALEDLELTITGNTYERIGSTFTLDSEYIGDVVVTLNGLTLAKDIDYTLSGYTLSFSGTIINGDVITFIFTRASTLTIVGESIQLTNPIVSGATDTQGSNRYFYNTTTGKYEVYTNNEPIDSSRIIVMLNGITLVNNIDYYQSSSNKNRIILNGVLMQNDIVTIVYYPKANVINGIQQAGNNIMWYIENQPQLNNGFFTLEYSPDEGFSTFTVNSVVDYEPLQTSYASVLYLSGTVGTTLYYRVRNTKEYVSICGDIIESTAFSEVVPVVIQSNALNTY